MNRYNFLAFFLAAFLNKEKHNLCSLLLQPTNPTMKATLILSLSLLLLALARAWDPTGMIYLTMYTYTEENCQGPSYTHMYFGCEETQPRIVQHG